MNDPRLLNFQFFYKYWRMKANCQRAESQEWNQSFSFFYWKMIKYTERNAKNSHTRSQLELKSKLVLNKSNLQTTRFFISRRKKKSAASLERHSSVLFLWHLYLLQYVMQQFFFNSTLNYTGEVVLTTWRRRPLIGVLLLPTSQYTWV